MKHLSVIAIMASILMSGYVHAQEHVNGYFRSNGTYVNSYFRSAPDTSFSNNYSTRGNTNPYSGESGTRSSYSNHESSMIYGTNPTNLYGEGHGTRSRLFGE